MVVSPPLARGIGGVVLSYFMSLALSPEGGVSAYAGSVRVRVQRCARGWWVRAPGGEWVTVCVGASPGLLLCVPCTTVDVSLRVFSAARTASSRAANVSTGDRTMSSTAERLVPSTSDGETARWPRQRRDVEVADQHATGKSGKSQLFLETRDCLRLGRNHSTSTWKVMPTAKSRNFY